MSLTLYVEGGGDSKEVRARCREEFCKLIEKVGFSGRMPRIVACGSRGNAFDSFRTATAMTNPNVFAILLVDSEAPVKNDPWSHLRNCDGWERPAGVSDEQVQLMATCMETWLMADRPGLRAFFGQCLQESALFPANDQLEQRTRADVRDGLESATRDCGRGKAYQKGKRSFQLLTAIDPQPLKVLPHFRRFIEALEKDL